MKHTLALIALVALIAGCKTRGSTGGYVIVNESDSRATIFIGGDILKLSECLASSRFVSSSEAKPFI